MDTEALQDSAPAERTHLSRAAGTVITTATRDRFDAAAHAVWPLLVARLRRAGASLEDAEDVAQEALLRAWDRGVHFADDGDLLRWCTVVARRSHIDRIRRQARILDLGDVASESARRDLEAVELRHVLGTVRTAFARLTEQERESLRATPSTPAADRATQVRTAVARHRARYRLRLLVGPFAALVGQLVRGFRRAVPAAVGVGALAAAVLSVTGGSSRHGPVVAAPPSAPVWVAHAPPAADPGGGRQTPAAPSRHAGGRVPRPHPASAAVVATRPADSRLFNIDLPAGSGASGDTDDKKPDDHLICVDASDWGLGDPCLR